MAQERRAPSHRLAACAHPLPLTGERTLPGVPRERYWFARHVAGYQRAASALAAYGRAASAATRVLDAGCGEGYGAGLLARRLATPGPAGRRPRVVGVDYAPDVIAHASARYPQHAFAVAEVTVLPFSDGAFDLAVSSQVIEHLWDVGRWLEEMARVLAPGGAMAVLTPNRRTFSPGGGPPANPFHATEFDAGELAAALEARFAVVAVEGIGHGQRLTALERRHGVALPDAQASAPPAQWPPWLVRAVATARPDDFALAPAPTSLDLLATVVRR